MIFLSTVDARTAIKLLAEEDAHELVGKGEFGKGKGKIAARKHGVAEAVAAADDKNEVRVAGSFPTSKRVCKGKGIEGAASNFKGDDKVVVFNMGEQAFRFFVFEGGNGLFTFLGRVFFVSDGDDFEAMVLCQSLAVFVDGLLPVFFLDFTDAEKGDIHYSFVASPWTPLVFKVAVCIRRFSTVVSSGVTK